MELKSDKIAQEINMSIKETKIIAENKKGVIIPYSIRSAYSPFTLEDIGALRLERGRKLEYLHIGFFDQHGKRRTVISNARSHPVFELAVKKDVGEVNNWINGQANLNENDEIDSLFLHNLEASGDLQNRRQIISMFESFDINLLDWSGVGVTYISGEQYSYNPISKYPLKISSSH